MIVVICTSLHCTTRIKKRGSFFGKTDGIREKVSIFVPVSKAGCSAARLACIVRDDEVGSSNLPTPTQSSKGMVHCTVPFFLSEKWESLFFEEAICPRRSI